MEDTCNIPQGVICVGVSQGLVGSEVAVPIQKRYVHV